MKSSKNESAGLSEEIQSILRCLACRGPLQPDGPGQVCRKCNPLYLLSNGVHQFADVQKYLDSFSFRWKLHAHTQWDGTNSRRPKSAFRNRTGFRTEDPAGQLVLDGRRVPISRSAIAPETAEVERCAE